ASAVISISSPIRGGDQRAAGRRLASLYTTLLLYCGCYLQ
ncbi:hypothetical protein HMPREF3185_00472, partial [Porphyromonas somerae]